VVAPIRARRPFRYRERYFRGICFLARRCIRLRGSSAMTTRKWPSRPAVPGVREAPFPRNRRRYPKSELHGQRHRRHGGRRVRQRHAAIALHRLVAAFNHLHIFIDPQPDPARSFAEREGCSSCRARAGDYSRSAISKGGGVFSRAAKSLTLSREAQVLLELPPGHANEVIKPSSRRTSICFERRHRHYVRPRSKATATWETAA